MATLKFKIIMASIMLLIFGGTGIFIAAKTVNPVFAPEIQEALKNTPTPEKVSTPSADTKNPATGTTRGLSPIPTLGPNQGGGVLLNCDLRQYGGKNWSNISETECRAHITELVKQDTNVGTHCSHTAAGCGSQQNAGTSGQIDLTLPDLGPGIDLNVTLPDHQKAIDDFNNAVKTTPIPVPCVPVGDGFNCLGK